MDMKLYKAILRTGGKTREQLIEQYIDNQYTEAKIDLSKRYYDQCDGLRVIVCDTSWRREGTFGLCGVFEESDEEQYKEAMWLAEQSPWSGAYIDQREEFERDWDSGDYELDGVLTFRRAEVEILEELSGVPHAPA